MTAALEGGEWSAARPGLTLPPGKTRYLFYRRLGGPQGQSGRAEKLVPTGIWSRTVQPVVSRYTDWATRPNARTRFGTKSRHTATWTEGNRERKAAMYTGSVIKHTKYDNRVRNLLIFVPSVTCSTAVPNRLFQNNSVATWYSKSLTLPLLWGCARSSLSSTPQVKHESCTFLVHTF